MPQTAPRRGPKIRAPISFFPPKIRPKSGVAFGAAWPLGLYLKVTRNAKEPRVQAERQQKAYSNFLLYISNRYSGNTLYTTVYIQTEVKKLQVLCSTLSVRRFMLKS